MTEPTIDPPFAPPTCRVPSAAALKLPRGACDAHFHVFGPRTRFLYALVDNPQRLYEFAAVEAGPR